MESKHPEFQYLLKDVRGGFDGHVLENTKL